jgi:NAD(P)-dependent dehydrogenase (short-subunit alcohol dehydrogenase family)
MKHEISTVLVTGGAGTLGRAIARKLKDVYVYDTFTLDMPSTDANIKVNLRDWAKVEEALKGEQFDAVVHVAGINKIAAHKDINADLLVEMMYVNCYSQFYLNRFLLSNSLNPLRLSLHIVSDAALQPFTHSLAYNMSKAAQLMMVRQMAHEIKPRDCTIFSVSPGKIANTGISNYIDKAFPPLRGMTFEEGREYQLSRLRTGEMDVEDTAEFVCSLFDTATSHNHGHNYIIGG